MRKQQSSVRYPSVKANAETYTWDQINTALTMLHTNPAQILRISQALKQVKRENLTIINGKD